MMFNGQVNGNNGHTAAADAGGGIAGSGTVFRGAGA